MGNEFYARLQPYNPRRGFLVQKHCFENQVYVGGPRPNWYLIGEELANTLRGKLQTHDDPDSKPLFQVVTPEEKMRIATSEQEQFLASLGAVGQTLVGPKDAAPPPTVDLRPELPKAPEAPVPEVVGRAAALPPTREQLQTENAAGAVTSKEVMSGRRGAGKADAIRSKDSGE
jgi:hypothetical protein